jgi:serine protease
VGAVTLAKRRAFYSNYGSVLDVSAPGGDESRDDNFDGLPDGILSLVNGGAGNLYAIYQGTSMAAPHVSGVAALMKAAHPALTAVEFDEILAGGRPGVPGITEDLGAPGWDPEYGHGLINATLAVIAARVAADNPLPEMPVLRLSTRELDFGAVETSLPVTIENIGAGTLAVTGVSIDQGWVTLAPGAEGPNEVTVDRTALPDGVHGASITIQTTGGEAVLRVRATIGPVVTGGDVGAVYVLLVDPETRQPRYEAMTTASSGYAFTFPRVTPGAYLLVAGTDLNGNLFIDDPGEVFGGYPVTGGLAPLLAGYEEEEREFAVQVRH